MRIKAVDLFCGAGGTSSGLIKACIAIGLDLELLAINHWDVAIKTHSENHPQVRHLCEHLDNVDPRKVVPGERLNLLVASPECTHHSIARGGKPVSDQSRASAWHIVRWAEALYIENIIIENVPEFRTWGPLGSNGRPLKSKKGQTFHAFLTAIRSLGYRVQHRVLNAADYGDATTRKRLFIIARRGNRKIKWPEPTHSPRGGRSLLRSTRAWRPAKEIIDWSIPGKSIFKRKRPLAPATLRRIEVGLRKFGGDRAVPFIVVLRQNLSVQGIDEPLPTITAGGKHLALCQPFLVSYRGGFDASRRVHSIDQPLPVLDTSNRYGVVQPFLLQLTHGGRCYPIDAPLPTITTARRGEIGIVEPFLVKFYGTADSRPLSEPIDTITSRDRYGLVQTTKARCHPDILFRMLQPHELAMAMGFTDGYGFSGTRADQVKQIGNAVPVGIATALCKSVLEEHSDEKRRCA